ncbi:MAG: hypothetical protein RLY17_1402, partial [Pseudomonadota bacterium]
GAKRSRAAKWLSLPICLFSKNLLTATTLPAHSTSAKNFTAGSLILLTTMRPSAMIAAILIYMKPLSDEPHG